MTRTFAVGPEPSLGQRLLRQALVQFVVYNPLFLFSAALVLGGAWLLNPPAATGGRDLGLLWRLFGVISLYELTLLGATWFLARRGELPREARNLALVLSPFLVDVTFTSAALLVSLEQRVGLTWAVLLAAARFGYVALCGRAAARLIGRRFGAAGWACLLAGPALVTSFPLAAGALARSGATPGELSWLGGLLLGGLVLSWGAVAKPDGALRPGLALVPLAVGAFHVIGTSWAHSGALALVLGPVCIALGPALPRLAWPGLRDLHTPLALPAAGALWCGLGRGALFDLASSWNAGLGAMVVTYAVVGLRTRQVRFAVGALIGLHLLLGGSTIEASLRAVGDHPLEPLALLALYGYGLKLRLPGPVVAVPLLLAAGLTFRLAPCGARWADLVLSLDLIGAGLLAYAHRIHGRSPAGAEQRFLGATLLYAPVCGQALAAPELWGHPASAVGALSLVALFLLGRRLVVRAYQLPALLLPAVAVVKTAPRTSDGWGTLGLGLSFLVVAAGVVLSLRRGRILAWLEERFGTELAAVRKG